MTGDTKVGVIVLGYAAMFLFGAFLGYQKASADLIPRVTELAPGDWCSEGDGYYWPARPTPEEGEILCFSADRRTEGIVFLENDGVAGASDTTISIEVGP